jgi:hypothetical protein
VVGDRAGRGFGKGTGVALETGKQVTPAAVTAVRKAEQFFVSTLYLERQTGPVAGIEDGVSGCHGQAAQVLQDKADAGQCGFLQRQAVGGQIGVGAVLALDGQRLRLVQGTRCGHRIVGRAEHAPPAGQLLLGVHQGRGLLLHRSDAQFENGVAADAHDLPPYLPMPSTVSNNMAAIWIILPLA